MNAVLGLGKRHCVYQIRLIHLLLPAGDFINFHVLNFTLKPGMHGNYFKRWTAKLRSRGKLRHFWGTKGTNTYQQHKKLGNTLLKASKRKIQPKLKKVHFKIRVPPCWIVLPMNAPQKAVFTKT